MADSVLTTKIAVLVLFFVATMLCGLLPMLLARLARFWTERFQTGRTGKLVSSLRRRGDLLVSCIMCLGAGVLLATIFTHMIPEVREVFAEIEEAGLFPDTGLPPGELFLCAGFFLVFFIEEAAHVCLTHGHRRKHRRAAAAAAAAEAGEKASEDLSMESEEAVHEGAAGHSHVIDLASQHAFRAYLIVIALSVHSVFEGFAAAFEDSAREVWLFFAAIMAHKAIVAFCIGEQLLSAKRSVCFTVTNLVILSLATPLGVLLGLVVTSPAQQGGASLLATGILQGLAAGTILYVTFFELLGPEQHKPGSRFLKFFSMLVGFGLMILIHSSGGHSHSHGGHSHAVGHQGHGAHNHGAVHGGHDHGNHAHQHDELAKRVESAIHAYDHQEHNHSGHADHHDHPGHSKEPMGSVHKHGIDNDNDHDHDHSHGHDAQHSHPEVSAISDATSHPEHAHDHSNHDHNDHSTHGHPNHEQEHASHDHDRTNHDHDNTSKDHDHSGHNHDNDHSDHHDHSQDPGHVERPKQTGNKTVGRNDTTYDIIGSYGTADGFLDVRAVPDRAGNGSQPGDESHHFHDDGHDHLNLASDDGARQHVEHSHDHSDHAGHDHSDHDPGQGDHKHSELDPHNQAERNNKQSADPVSHDHAAHKHGDHSDHEHSESGNQTPGPTAGAADRSHVR